MEVEQQPPQHAEQQLPPQAASPSTIINNGLENEDKSKDTTVSSSSSETTNCTTAAGVAWPFTQAELDSFLKVATLLTADIALLNDKSLRAVRKVCFPLSSTLESLKFGGLGEKAYRLKKELELEREARRMTKKRNDAAYIQKSQLRASRQEKLRGLLNSRPELPMIADGAAVENVSGIPKLLANDASTCEAVSTSDADAPSSNTLLTTDAEDTEQMDEPRACYMCKCRFNTLHHFYDLMCPSCASFNYVKRHATCDLVGKVALVTGARVKIGYQTTLKLLMAGATVIATSRFPIDCAARFKAEATFPSFQSRLHIYGIDFRDMVALQSFLNHLITTFGRMDMVINNACQTIRRPAAYYRHLIQGETSVSALSSEPSDTEGMLAGHRSLLAQRAVPWSSGNSSKRVRDEDTKEIEKSENTEDGVDPPAPTCNDHLNLLTSLPSALQSQLVTVLDDEVEENAAQASALTKTTSSTLFPTGALDVNNQQIDLRTRNSWLLTLGSVSTPEVAEVFAINTLAPFVINNALSPLMAVTASPISPAYIINVSAMEGKFYRYKTPRHPHTNMAKAALNMMTRTCAEALARDCIYMNSVDTGWINDENPLSKAVAIEAASNFQTPIDEVDAAARIVDPIFSGEKLSGQFFKDYRPTEW